MKFINYINYRSMRTTYSASVEQRNMYIFNIYYTTINIFLIDFFCLNVLSQTQSAVTEDHPNCKLLPTNCGKGVYSNRIVGGKEAELGQYPWIARLGYKLPHCPKKIFYRCAGALINELYVVTAGHCFVNLPNGTCDDKEAQFYFAKIILGEYNTKTNPDCVNARCARNVQVFRSNKVITHDKYDKPPYGNDIALIRLNRPARLNGWVTTICLQRGEQLNNFYLGKYGIVAGWGMTSATEDLSSNILMAVKVPIVDTELCKNSFKYRLILERTVQMCAGGQKDKDSCDGDSGAPLMYLETSDQEPRYFALGLVSFGVKRCGFKDKPAIYTRLAGYMNWILDHIEP